jgi:tetratricopeptide (TPR) repeat protein
MALQRLLEAAQDRLDRWSAGDVTAVTDGAARDLVARLEALGDGQPLALSAAGSLSLVIYLQEEDFLEIEGLDRAVSLFARIPHQDVPELLAGVFTADIRPDLEPARPGAPCHPAQLVTAAVHMREELADDSSLDDIVLLRLAAGLTRLAFEYAQPDGTLVASLLAIHAEALLRVVGATRDPELLPEMLAVRRLSLAKARPDEEKLDEIRHELVMALVLLYSFEGDPALLAEAREIVDEDLPEPAEIAIELRDEVLYWQRLRRRDYKDAALGYAATAMYKLAGGTEPDSFWDVPEVADDLPDFMARPQGEIVEVPRGPGLEPLRGMSLNLNESITRQIDSEIAGVPATDPGARAALLAELADHHRHRYLSTLRSRDLVEQAVDQSREAVRICPRDDPRYPTCLLALYRALLLRLQLDEDPADLDEVIEHLRRFLSLGSVTEPEGRARHLADLASYLMARHETPGRHDDLDEAHRAASEAVRLAPEGSPVALLARAGLGVAILGRHYAGAPDADLDTAVGLLREGSRLPPSDENHTTVLKNLSTALLARYYAGAPVTILDEAVTVAREAWDATPSEQWMVLHQAHGILAGALGLRYRELGALSDLDDAVALSREVLAALPDRHSSGPLARSELAELLATRAERTGSTGEHAEAIRLARTAVREAGRGGPYAERAQSALATVLGAGVGDPDERAARFREAVAIHRTLPPGQSRRIELARLLQFLFVTLSPGRPAFELSREAERLLRQARRAATTTELDVDLGAVLYERARRGGSQWTMRRAGWRLGAAALDGTIRPFQRVMAARMWGAALGAAGKWPQALAAYRLATGLLPAVAPRTLLRADREFRLSRIADLASDAAAAALRAGDPAAAIQMFDAGRRVLWAEMTRARQDLATLSGAAPELAARYTRLRDALDEPYTRAPLSAESAGQLSERRRRLGEEWRDLTREVQRLRGGERPSAPGSPHPGVDGVGVMLAASIHGGHAILLRPGGRIETLALPRVTPDRARDAADRVRDAVAVIQERASPLSMRLDAEARIQAVLDWLWTAVTGPILDRVEGDPPRVWWMPAGPLASLPIHAAGDALTRARSSYSFSLKDLRTARPTPPAPGRTLVVAMPETPAAAPLPGARAEAELLRTGYGAVGLVGEEATKDAVLAALAGCEVAHFACHSAAGPPLPGVARLLLHDHQTRPLTLLDVAGLHLPQARLAYLSSCATLTSGHGLADEAVHLAAAYQHAGFPEVIGTLWPVDDEKAALPIARSFYARLPQLGAAEALRSATLDLAREYPRSPSFWAGYVHVGA